jgi:engulfment/cell motility protein 1
MSAGANPLTQSPAVNGAAGSAVPLVPTNTVTTAAGLTVRTRIDPVLTVDDVVKQLCINLKIKEPPSNFALRDETDELVTNDNLRRKIKTKVNLKYVVLPLRCNPLAQCYNRLVNAPSREAGETAEKLRLREDPTTLKMTLFTLQKYIRVGPQFDLEAFELINFRRNNSHRRSLIVQAFPT